MSSHVTLPAGEIRHLVLGELAGDARIQGAAEDSDIDISYVESGQPNFSPDGEMARFSGAPVERVRVPAGIHVSVEGAAGDLRVQDLSGDLELNAVHGDLRLVRLTGNVRVVQVNGDLRAEEIADLYISEACNGDAHLEDGSVLQAGSVSGDLRVERFRGLTVERIHGDFWSGDLAGALHVDRVDGDARISGIAGPAIIDSVAGDLRADGIAGGLTIQMVNGDVDLGGSLGAESEYRFSARGDIDIQLPASADLRLTVRASGRIRSDVQLTPAPNGAPSFTAVLGRGTGQLAADAGGDLRLRQHGAEGRTCEASYSSWHDMGERIRQQVASSLAAAGIDVEADQFGWGGAGPGRARRGRGAPPPRPGAPRPPDPSRPPEAPRGPATERNRPADRAAPPTSEEKDAILKMLEAGTITAEEAERLFRALGA